MRRRLPRWLRWKLYEIEKAKIPVGLSQREYDDKIKEITRRLRL